MHADTEISMCLRRHTFIFGLCSGLLFTKLLFKPVNVFMLQNTRFDCVKLKILQDMMHLITFKKCICISMHSC